MLACARQPDLATLPSSIQVPSLLISTHQRTLFTSLHSGSHQPAGRKC